MKNDIEKVRREDYTGKEKSNQKVCLELGNSVEPSTKIRRASRFAIDEWVIKTMEKAP